MTSFLNVSDYGDVCWVQPECKTLNSGLAENLMEHWEDPLGYSEFTHLSGDTKIKSKDLQKLMTVACGTRKSFLYQSC